MKGTFRGPEGPLFHRPQRMKALRKQSCGQLCYGGKEPTKFLCFFIRTFVFSLTAKVSSPILQMDFRRERRRREGSWSGQSSGCWNNRGPHKAPEAACSLWKRVQIVATGHAVSCPQPRTRKTGVFRGPEDGGRIWRVSDQPSLVNVALEVCPESRNRRWPLAIGSCFQLFRLQKTSHRHLAISN